MTSAARSSLKMQSYFISMRFELVSRHNVDARLPHHTRLFCYTTVCVRQRVKKKHKTLYQLMSLLEQEGVQVWLNEGAYLFNDSSGVGCTETGDKCDITATCNRKQQVTVAIFSSAGAVSQMPVTQSCCSLARYRRDEKTQRGRATKEPVYKVLSQTSLEHSPIIPTGPAHCFLLK